MDHHQPGSAPPASPVSATSPRPGGRVEQLAEAGDRQPPPPSGPSPSGPSPSGPSARGLSARGQSPVLSAALRLVQAGPLFVLACIWVVFALLSPYFLTQSNLTNILVQSSSVGLLSLGALVVVVVGSLDLSLGSTVGLCTIAGAVVFRDHPSSSWLVLLAILGAGLAIGIVNSLVIVVLRFGNAFIVTLGMLYAVQSLSYVGSGGTQVPGLPSYVQAVANGKVAGIPGPILLVLIASGALAFFLNRVVWGRWIVAIGGNADAAARVGIPVRRVMFSVYVIASLLAAVAGFLVAGLNNAGAPDSGNSILLAIAAVVIGGARLTGGRGSVWATLAGAVILGTITNGLTLLSVSPNWTPFAVGAVLIAAVGLDTLRSNIEGRLRVRQAQIQAGAQ